MGRGVMGYYDNDIGRRATGNDDNDDDDDDNDGAMTTMTATMAGNLQRI